MSVLRDFTAHGSSAKLNDLDICCTFSLDGYNAVVVAVVCSCCSCLVSYNFEGYRPESTKSSCYYS